MAPPTSEPSLKLEDHRAFQFGFWRLQRIAWIGFAFILVAALAGLTGAGGPLSRASTGLAGGEIDHPRVSRWSAADQLRIRWVPGSGERAVLLSTGFDDHFQLENVQPAPSRSLATADGERLIFETEPGRPASVVLHVRAHKPGMADYAVSLDDGPPRVLRSVILP